MVDLSDFIAHSPNAKRGQIPDERRQRLNDALEDLNPALYGSDTGQFDGGGNDIPTQGLVSYWPLDDLADGTAEDYVGTHDGTLENGVSSGDGQQDGAASFDGDDDVITTDLNIGAAGESFTVSGFLRAPSGQEFSQNHFFLSNYIDRRHDGFFAIGSDDAETMFFWLRGSDLSTKKKVSSDSIVFDGEFHHYVGVREAENDEMRFYIDGEHSGTKSFQGDVAVKDSDSFFGMMQHYGNRNLSETVDDVRIYNRALSDTEVETLYDATNTSGQT